MSTVTMTVADTLLLAVAPGAETTARYWAVAVNKAWCSSHRWPLHWFAFILPLIISGLVMPDATTVSVWRMCRQ